MAKKPDKPGPWGPQLHEIALPEYRWWVQVKNADGRVGWTDEPENFGNKDRCG